jgi:hypothetical protein
VRIVDLGGRWRFNGDGRIEVPGVWEAQGHLTLDGTAVYERDVELDRAHEHATLEFDAVADLCEVYVNGAHAGAHEAGFTPFALDVSGMLHAGTNTIRVDVTDPPRGTRDYLRTPQGKQGWGSRVFPSPPSVYLTYGGIWQPCRLVVHGPAYIEDVWCDMDPSGPTVAVEVRGDGEAEIHAFGQLLRGTRATFEPGAAGWPGAVHTIRAVVPGSHERTVTTGLRRVERHGDDIFIDGRPYRMRSALHQGFWPRGLYAADEELIERDVQAALGAGLNTLRTHLKAFEPAWLDAADRAGLHLHCDLPIGEPLEEAALFEDEDFVRRCLVAAREQVRRDRSRPSIVLWTLTNELCLACPDALDSEPYRAFIDALTREVRALDPSRPIVENDWVDAPPRLVHTDIRTPHWYGRASKGFLDTIDERLHAAAPPVYVTEFGEWGLPDAEAGRQFWDQDLWPAVAEAGWTGTYEAFAAGTQVVQGWSARIQAERFRTHNAMKGFCLTEWTDVPHELNGLVTLRRNPKRAIEEFRPALADLAPIAVTDRYAYAADEPIAVRVFASNWSGSDLDASDAGAGDARVRAPRVRAGGVAYAGELSVPAGDIVLRWAGAESRYPVHVCPPPAPRGVRVEGSPALANALARAGWVTDDPDAVAVAFTDTAGPAVLLEPAGSVAGLPDPVDLPQSWGPTPFVFTTAAIASLPPRAVLSHEIFHISPRRAYPGVRGPVGFFVPPPWHRWGAVVAVHDGVVACQLAITDALVAGDRFALALFSDLVDLATR